MSSETSAPPSGDPLLGRVLCGCEILSLICQGGMGRLYRARQVSLDRIVAVKVLSPALSANEEFLGRFRREARALANLLHPSIVAIHDFGEEGDIHAIVMEYVEGENVGDILVRVGVMPIPKAINIVRQVAEGLACAHQRNIIHCDLKPENILITPSGSAKLADFGLAKSIRGEAGHITRDGIVLGTPTYMSPEQCAGGKLDPRTDIYSLGATFYRMVAGRDAFEADDAFSVMLKHQNEPPMDPRRHNPAVPNAIARIILRMIEKPRENRYQAAAEVARALIPYDSEASPQGQGAQEVEHPRREFAVAPEAIEAGLITPAQLRSALARQEQEAGAAPDLAAILVEEGLLTDDQARKLAERTHGRDEARADEEFARLALEAGLATREQIAQCMREQRMVHGGEGKSRLPRLLGAAGAMKPTEVAELLLRQLKETQRAEDTELLDILRHESALREEDIERCIAEQKRREAQGKIAVLRQIILDMGMMPGTQLRELLRKKLRQEVLLYLAERERARSPQAEAIIPKDRDLKLEEEAGDTCPSCGKTVPFGQKSCSVCGQPMGAARTAQTGPRAASGRPAGAPPRAPAARRPAAEPASPKPHAAGPPPPPGDSWEIRLPNGEPSPPLIFAALVRLVREKRVQPATVLRGPATAGVWRQARFTPKLCRLFGTCHYCGAKLLPDATACAECKTDPDQPHRE
ncbi:MAG: hypothetical protein FJ291_29520 [Planctomycetes bacterium]|nr:hypothetical protein [Planctomycetota bacterium]